MSERLSLANELVRRRRTPPHLFRPHATYILTARTLYGRPYLEAPSRRQQLLDSLRFAAAQREWKLIAWAVLPEHYHCLLVAPDEAGTLTQLVQSVHRFTAAQFNREDATPGRQVWYRYWDTCITSEPSFYARLNYIHHNPVKHGLAQHPAECTYSSYSTWHNTEDFDLENCEAAFPWDLLDLE